MNKICTNISKADENKNLLIDKIHVGESGIRLNVYQKCKHICMYGSQKCDGNATK